MDREKILKAGEIAFEIRRYARSIIKKGLPLLEIAEKIEEKIVELGGKSAFPLNLSINDIAAHYTPSHDDKTTAYGLLKVDIGVHVDGWVADTAFSIDLENSEENKKIILASEKALEKAITTASLGVSVSSIGKAIQETIESYKLSPIINLSGHGIEHYNVHSNISIPNFDNKKNIVLQKGQYAIEPFATSGVGKVYDGKPSGIYKLINDKNVRSPIAKETLNLIKEKYRTLPFCSRWVVKELGTKALFGLRQLEEQGILHHFLQLVESSHGKVAQAEHTILIEDSKTLVTTRQ